MLNNLPKRGFTSTSEKDNENVFSLSSNAGGAKPKCNFGFTMIELLTVVAVISILAAIVLSLLADARLSARDKRRVADIQQVQKALELYHVDHNGFPSEASGANGNISTNATFLALIDPYIQGEPIDPAGVGNRTFYYYYDGSHNCGGTNYAVLIARQMEKSENINYDSFFNTTCGGVLDGEGRGAGQESYNIIIGFSSD